MSNTPDPKDTPERAGAPGAERPTTPGSSPAGTGSRADEAVLRAYTAGSRAAKPTAGEEPSLGELVGKVSRDLSTLIRQEIELAKAEAKQSAQRAGKGAGMLGGAGVAGYMVLLFLSVALWWWLGALVGGGWSALIVAGVWAVVAAVLALRGRSAVRSVEGMPQTADSVKKIPHALRGHEEKSS